ncbi:MAG TPA: GGDEF domain-containing protein [Cellulomonas sp.]
MTDSARLYLAARHVAFALAVCAVLTLAGGIWPPSPDTRVVFWYVSAAILTAVALGAYLLRERRGTAVVALVAGVLVCGLLIAVCRTLAGVVTTGLGLVVAGQAAALMGGPTTARRVLELVLGVLAVAMTVSPVGFRPSTWLVMSATTVVSSAFVAQLAARLRRIATTDDLTGALTRAAFESRVASVLSLAGRRGTPTTVVCVDVDDFKVINDTQGHLAGDDVLVDLVDGWRDALGPQDAIGRIGGDEFAVVLTGATVEDSAAWVQRALLLGPDDAPSWSYGVAEAREGESIRSLLGRADEAMYVRKGRREAATAEAALDAV